jgi:hypothetical protein
MPIRFYRRFRAGPFRLNVSKRGVSYSVGGRGFWYTVGRNHTRTTLSPPGTRELIRERTGEGRKRAMAAGVKFGRKRKLSDYQRSEAIKRRDAGETLADIANSYGVHLAMISRL